MSRFTSIVFLVEIVPSSSEQIHKREVENWGNQLDNYLRRLFRNNDVDAQITVGIHPDMTKEE